MRAESDDVVHGPQPVAWAWRIPVAGQSRAGSGDKGPPTLGSPSGTIAVTPAAVAATSQAMSVAARRLHPQGFVAPCLPTLALAVPGGDQWAHEIKHDGFRMICRREGKRTRVFSRNALDWF